MKKYFILATLAIGFLAGASALSVFATGTWTAPTATPPAGNVPAPVNVGDITQEKAAGLWLHGGLAVDGNVIIATGTPSAGKVLTAVDGTGLVTWGTGGGGSNSGSGWISVPLNDSTSFDKSCQYRWETGSYEPIYQPYYGSAPVFYANSVDPDRIAQVHNGVVAYIKSTLKSEWRVFFYTQNQDVKAVPNPVTKIEKNCGGSGSSSSSSSSSSGGTLATRYCTNAQSLAGGPQAVPECVAAASISANTPANETWRPVSCGRGAAYRETMDGTFMNYKGGVWNVSSNVSNGYWPDWACLDGTVLIINTRASGTTGASGGMSSYNDLPSGALAGICNYQNLGSGYTTTPAIPPAYYVSGQSYDNSCRCYSGFTSVLTGVMDYGSGKLNLKYSCIKN